MDFITKFTKKSESGNIVYLTCSKRGNNSKNCPGKAKFNRKSGLVEIYKECKNEINLHTTMDFEKFKEHYDKNNFEGLNMELRLYQTYYIKCLIIDNKIRDYTDANEKFYIRFKKKLILNEEYFRKIKYNILGGVNNMSLEDICKSLKINDNDIRVDIYTIKSKYKNPKNKQLEYREQNIIVLGKKKMIDYLNSEKYSQYGIDATFKVIPRSLKPYKLITLYAIDPINNKTVIASLIFIKYMDKDSLDALFRQLTATFNFSPICITTDYDNAQITALKNCSLFKKTPYIIACLFHLSQSYIRKFKQLKIMKQKRIKDPTNY